MENPKPNRSRRFSVSRPAQVIIPVLLVLLALGLLAALALVLMAVLGLTPGV